ncbi:hypothetical protein H2200_003630 [Cladophialophora chaetospira]|uniref:Cytochrome P450 n=1 Tax=Cladophialophora chaetospira TaxID=386627 RepID=A0AA39CKW8_9EURO|nr:hypothetical protein H2200_003630 [Cladophialophora chaetospira]
MASFSALPLDVLGLVAIVTVFTYILYQRFFSPLARVPGPFLASITSFWIAHAYWRQDWHYRAISLHKQYGPVVRVGPDAVDVGDVDAIKIIYGMGLAPCSHGFELIEAIRDRIEILEREVGRGGGNLIGMTDEPLHKQRRRLVDPIYTLKSVRESEHLMNAPITFFAEQMRRHSGTPVDIIEWTNVLAVDVFTAITYGKSYGLLEHGRDPEMLAFTEANWNPYFWAVMVPLLGRLVKIRQRLLILAKVLLSGGKAPLPILGWTTEQIENALQSDESAGNAPTLSRKAIRIHRAHPKEFPRAALNDHMFELVFAGFETCGATIPKIIWRIATTRDFQKRLQTELDTLSKTDTLKGLLTYDQLLELPYLSACISEGMRMDPITGIALSRRVPPEGVRMNGYDLPGGTEIGITPRVISYNEDLVEDPYRFSPDRWLDATKEQKILWDRMDLMFSAGPTACTGKVMALAFIYKVIAAVFSNFDVTVIDKDKKIEEINIFPVKWRKVKMKLSPRKAE